MLKKEKEAEVLLGEEKEAGKTVAVEYLHQLAPAGMRGMPVAGTSRSGSGYHPEVQSGHRW